MRKLFFMFSFLLVGKVCLSQVATQHLLTENLANPIGIDAPSPRFSWQLTAGNRRNVMQSAYQLRVGTDTSSAQSIKNMVWKSGKVSSDQSAYIPYKGNALVTGQKYYWQVKVWDNYGKASNWSKPASFLVGMLTQTDWKAQWITPGFNEDTAMRPSPIFRKAFPVTKKIRQAVAFITAHGLYEAEINGHKVGDAYLTPGWTSYTKRLQYQAYDVTALLQQGKNVVGATLGNGWYRGFIGTKPPMPGLYGKDIALLFQMEITYTDGTKTTVLSDNSWKSSTAQVRYAEIYYGSNIDNRLQQKGWSTSNFDDKNWSGVKTGNFSKDVLVATINEPVKKHEAFKPVKIFTTPKGEKVIDFGQNLVGWVRLKIKGNSGDKIIISHAEVLDKTGNFYTENLRTARSQDTFILKGGEEETFEPAFTFHGFRYIKIEGYEGEIRPENFTAYALYSDMAPAGSFSCSNPLINQLQSNIQWGQKGNFLDVPTDCPQRDERMGWTGDAQVFSRTASYNMNVHAFFDKWLRDLSADQYVTGSVPKVIPNIIVAKDGPGGSTGWADVTTIVPWDMYLAYGDKQILKNQYNSMKAWVRYMQDQSKNYLWQSGKHYGDWLFYSVNDDRDGTSAITSKYLIAQCFFAHSVQLVINTAKLLGNTADEAYYTIVLHNVKDAYLKEYVTPNGLISSDTQTAYALALQFDMLPEHLRQQAAARLVSNIRRYNNHISTGFLGTPYICHVLSRFGYADVAYQLLLQDTYPSWLYPVKMGATTIWERWDGIKPDGSFEISEMNSFNHYAYGAIGDWMYRVIAGIDTKIDGPGYKQIIIKPTIGGNLTNVNADYETIYGKVSSHWKIYNGKLQLDVTIPANTTATIYVPATKYAIVLENDKAITSRNDIKPAGEQIDGYIAVNVGSGNYHFSTIRQ
jgi:alpha-L-rhamnosidase